MELTKPKGIEISDYKKLLPIFKKELLFSFNQLSQSLNDKNTDLILEFSHKIKGVSKSYGALNAANLAEEIEKNATHTSFVEIAKLVSSLDDVICKVELEINQML